MQFVHMYIKKRKIKKSFIWLFIGSELAGKRPGEPRAQTREWKGCSENGVEIEFKPQGSSPDLNMLPDDPSTEI